MVGYCWERKAFEVVFPSVCGKASSMEENLGNITPRCCAGLSSEEYVICAICDIDKQIKANQNNSVLPELVWPDNFSMAVPSMFILALLAICICNLMGMRPLQVIPKRLMAVIPVRQFKASSLSNCSKDDWCRRYVDSEPKFFVITRESVAATFMIGYS